MVGWTRGDQSLRWTIDVPAAGVYAVNVLIGQTSGPSLDLRVSAGGASVTSPFREDPRGSYSRSPLDPPLRLTSGRIDVTLFVVPRGPGPFAVEVLAVELVRPSVRDALHEEAMALRADARWMPRARYGVMFHWTKRTMPRSGPPRSYADAADAFDVERFAAQVASTGAGFVVLTTAHSDQYLPAPIRALDRVLPGRTTRRDLIRDLIGALQKRGIRLVLYYHLGPIEDPEWARASGLFETDSRRLFDNWQAIVGEVGERYGEKLAGWWFDDGIYNTYYRSPDWAALGRAAKRGHPGRVVGFNSWKNTTATEFQDFHCGEELVPDGANAFLNRDGSFGGTLVAGGDGRITSGAFAGLQAAATFMMESDWVHLRPDTEAAPPKRSPAELAEHHPPAPRPRRDPDHQHADLSGRRDRSPVPRIAARGPRAPRPRVNLSARPRPGHHQDRARLSGRGRSRSQISSRFSRGATPARPDGPRPRPPWRRLRPRTRRRSRRGATPRARRRSSS